ncbi:helix-turn-helix transcriptional regulator [Lactobacillus sp. ESL0681]|uniref:helix-turn-helix domain-containing protein n=1 Tax=Lactobacillus sp. ESL0681 TaxID=2983211 RepID=UPI0023F9E771|nr:helix-turn-helix transcriptional regulator [Lactobacillus sp. ESL0681]WEV40463.1 helix-turn-helix transcriptional regulator [Lactobacillus sp. ESL0681]
MIILEFGEAFRKIRLGRGISQEDLAKDLFSRETISKIESGKIYCPRANYDVLLERLGVSDLEFKYIQANYSFTPKEKILYQLLDISHSTETNKIEQLLKKCSKIENDSDIERISLILQADLIISKDHDIEKAKKLVQPIWYNHLQKFKLLTINDIYILNMIAYAFDNVTNQEIISKVLDEIDKHYPFLKSLKCSVLINSASLYLDNHNFAAAKTSLTKAAAIAKANHQYDKLLLCQAEIAICNHDILHANHYAKLLEEIGADHIAPALKSEIESFS